MNNVALVSMISKSFIPGFVGFITSFLQNNPWFNLSIVLIDIDLNEEERQYCKLYYSNIVYKKPNKKLYTKVNWKNTKPQLWNTYYTLDVFCYKEFDRIIFIDLDTIVLQDIKYLFEHQLSTKIAGVKAYNRIQDQLVDYINTGVFVVDMKKISSSFYKNIVGFSYKGFLFPEQDTINRYMHKQISFLPKEYNVEKRMLLSSNYPFDIEKVKILHYVALKPWQEAKRAGQRNDRKDFGELEKLWWEFFNKGVKDDRYT